MKGNMFFYLKKSSIYGKQKVVVFKTHENRFRKIANPRVNTDKSAIPGGFENMVSSRGDKSAVTLQI